MEVEKNFFRGGVVFQRFSSALSFWPYVTSNFFEGQLHCTINTPNINHKTGESRGEDQTPDFTAHGIMTVVTNTP